MSKALTTDQIKAQDQAIVSKLVGAGHQIEPRVYRDRLGRWSVSLDVWHRNDTKRLNGTIATINAYFASLADAGAYIRNRIRAAA